MFIIDIDKTLADPTHRAGFLTQASLTPGMRWAAFFRPDRVAKDPVIAEAKVVQEVIERGIDLAFLTARPESLRNVTAAWLQQHFPHDPDAVPLIMKPNNKMMSPASDWKVEEIRNLTRGKPFYFIDDDAGNLDAVTEAYPGVGTSMYPQDGFNFIRSELDRFETQGNDAGTMPVVPDGGQIVDGGMFGDEDYGEDDDF